MRRLFLLLSFAAACSKPAPPPPTCDACGPPEDLAVAAPAQDDLALSDAAPVDASEVTHDGDVGPHGGSVDRLLFGFTGDTRPAQCGGSYPQAVIDNIFTMMKDKGVQFALDQGDHMFNCGSAGESSALCSTASSYGSNPNYTAFLDALAPISPKPYYRFDVMTQSGLAVFLVVADDAWDSAQQAWLSAQLTLADAHAKYTFVSKHHPDGNTDHPEFQVIYDLVRQHKYTLFLTGHSHQYRRDASDPRSLVMGCGGAPLAGGTFWGFGTVSQGADDRISVHIFDQATGNVMDSFDVAPQ